jgi:hypothetical protein
LRYLTQTGGITPLGVFSDAFPGYKMWVIRVPIGKEKYGTIKTLGAHLIIQ